MLEELKDAINYIENKSKNKNIVFDEMEQYAQINNVPIVTKDVAGFLRLMTEMKKPANILEIGSAIGYSGGLMAETAMKYGGKIVTIEIDTDKVEIAKENFKKLNLENIEIINGDAGIVLDSLAAKYDMVFIDAAKGQYFDFFKKSYDLTNNGGIIIIDNIMFRGYVYKDEYPPRYKTIVKRLREFIDILYNEYDFTLMPFGDGVGVVIKK